jgi:hypothetical protein
VPQENSETKEVQTTSSETEANQPQAVTVWVIM